MYINHGCPWDDSICGVSTDCTSLLLVCFYIVLKLQKMNTRKVSFLGYFRAYDLPAADVNDLFDGMKA